jgi:hypothetical protein
MDRENFYLLLELSISPPENDSDTINAAISRKQAQWSKLRNHPLKGRQAQLYLDLLPDIKEVMADDRRRGEEAEEANRILAAREKEKFQDLDDAIQLLSSKKQITGEELRKIALHFSIPEDEVRKRINVPIVETPEKKEKVKGLDPAVAKKIADALGIIGKGTLYQFLDLSPSTSIALLLKKTGEKDARLKRDSHKDARLTAGLELVGHCLNVFKSEEIRKMYDATLTLRRLTEIDKAIDIAGLDGVVEPAEFDALVKKARELGLTLEDAEEYITEYSRKKKWAIRKPTAFSVENMKQCGNCGIMNVSGSGNCGACGYALTVSCPNCKTSNPSTNTYCSHCGFAIGDMPNALVLIKAGNRSKNSGDWATAAGLFRQALDIWPGNIEAEVAFRETKEKERVLAELVRDINRHLHDRHYYRARDLLLQLKQQAPGHPLLEKEKEVSTRIQEAENWVKKAGQAARGEDAMDFFAHALRECKDCQEAIDGMANHPPDPPPHLQVSATNHAISLQWRQSPSRGAVTYRVVRKARTNPLNPLEGDILGETPQLFFNDADIQPGVLYFYNVYAKRGEVFSTLGAVCGPVMCTGEIENLSVIAGDASVTLEWVIPDRAASVEVWMKPGEIPTGRRDGQLLQGVRRDGAVAAGLKNRQVYGFLVIAVFKNQEGASVYSIGASCQARPEEPPPPVLDLAVDKQDNRLDIHWTPPAWGTVGLLSSRAPFTLPVGRAISVGQLPGIGTQVPVKNRDSVQLPVDFQGVMYFLPITLLGDLAVPGKPALATSINDVANLKGTINGDKLYLEWDWPTGAGKVLIMHGYDHFPTLEDGSTVGKTVFNLTQYMQHSAFVLRSLEPRDYYFSVYVIAGDGADVIYSTGKQFLIANTPVREVYYDMGVDRTFTGRINGIYLNFFTKNERFKLPETVLVAKNTGLPLGKNDGTIIKEIPPLHVSPQPTNVEVGFANVRPGVLVKLFFKDEQQHRKFRLMSPAIGKLKVN